MVEVLRSRDPFVAVLVDNLDAVRLGVGGDRFVLPRKPVALDLPLAPDSSSSI
jgi:hypothetical protein